MNLDYQALYKLVERECYWLHQRVDEFKGKKYVLFPAGPTGQAFYYTLLNEYGIEAEFFIDNNAKFKGKSVCGKPVTYSPWEKNPNFVYEYVVLIPTSPKFYFQIVYQLETAGISAYMSMEAFCMCQLWRRYKAIANVLYDDLSKISYLAAIFYLCTYDNTFIQCIDNHYFALPNFVENNCQIIVDAGAYVGDTLEEYVKRGTEGVKIYAFEPYDKAITALERRVRRLKSEWMLNKDDITIVPAGVGAETKKISFSQGGNPTMIKPNKHGNLELPVYSLDDYFKGKEPFTLLKADIEGGEMDMLIGAKEIIQKVKPKMTLCIYHSPSDFARIIEYVKTLVPEYRLAVRNHYPDHKDTTLYCWC